MKQTDASGCWAQGVCAYTHTRVNASGHQQAIGMEDKNTRELQKQADWSHIENLKIKAQKHESFWFDKQMKKRQKIISVSGKKY